jgi:glucokinase
MNDADRRTFVGIDIGATNARLAIVDESGRIMADRQGPTPTGDDGEDLVRWLEEAYHACRSETDSFSAPEAIGVGVPGVLEPSRSAVIRAVNMSYIEGLPLRDRLIERTGLVTILDCDAVAAAWGEFCVRDRGPKRFAYLTIGTGIGGAIILGGSVLRHTHHSAGHLGHIICDTSDDAPVCACGHRGCLEAVVAGPALNKFAERCGIVGGIEQIEIAHHENDPPAARFLDTMSRFLAVGFVTIAHLYAVDRLVVGGGVSTVLPSLVKHAASVAAESGSALIPESMRVELSALGEYSGVVGAALLAAEHVKQT